MITGKRPRDGDLGRRSILFHAEKAVKPHKRFGEEGKASGINSGKAFAVENRILHALQSWTLKRNEIIPFAEVERILSFWRIRKTQRDEFLHNMEVEGKIQIVNFKGIKIRRGVKP